MDCVRNHRINCPGHDSDECCLNNDARFVNSASLTEKLIQAAVDYESGRCSRRELSEAREAVEAAIVAEWELIETAPTDGTWILIWETVGINNAKSSPAEVAHYHLGDWYNADEQRLHGASHWMPLPAPPTKGK